MISPCQSSISKFDLIDPHTGINLKDLIQVTTYVSHTPKLPNEKIRVLDTNLIRVRLLRVFSVSIQHSERNESTSVAIWIGCIVVKNEIPEDYSWNLDKATGFIRYGFVGRNLMPMQKPVRNAIL
jgi:hypothetical protein